MCASGCANAGREVFRPASAGDRQGQCGVLVFSLRQSLGYGHGRPSSKAFCSCGMELVDIIHRFGPQDSLPEWDATKTVGRLLKWGHLRMPMRPVPRQRIPTF